jgi:hypothetical protein
MNSPNHGEEAVASGAQEAGFLMSQPEELIRNLLALLGSLEDAQPRPELVSETLDRLDEVHPSDSSPAEPA